MPRTEAPWRGLSSLLNREADRLFFVFALFATLTPAQTLPQAEALWKARHYQDANAVFRDLMARDPRNPLIRVRWGRMFLEHWQADEADRLFDEALELKPDDAGALLAKKEQLEQAIDQLKYEKAGMDAGNYRKRLTLLLLDLAKTQEALDAPH